MSPSPWLLLRSGLGGYAWNMAVDAALLEAVPRLGLPVLRFYGWNESAASFGYFQHYRDVESFTALRPLVRRPTGGGVVPHNADWTYSLVFPTSNEWYSTAAVESYRRVHEWLGDAFRRLGIATELAGHGHKLAPGQCFAGYELFDLLCNGRKIAGAAQRRRREGLLIQGSVQPPSPALTRSAWEEAVCHAATAKYSAQWLGFELDAPLRERAMELEHRVYSTSRYNRKR